VTVKPVKTPTRVSVLEPVDASVKMVPVSPTGSVNVFVEPVGPAPTARFNQ